MKTLQGWTVARPSARNAAVAGAWVVAVCLLSAGTALAKGDFAERKAIPVLLTLGSEDNKLVFTPDRLRFETGQLYKLLLVNASPMKHELASPALSDAVFTVRTEVVSPQGEEIAEIEGRVSEIEVGPGTTVEWYFVPLRTVQDAPFICDLPGHLAGGMHGRFSIE